MHTDLSRTPLPGLGARSGRPRIPRSLPAIPHSMRDPERGRQTPPLCPGAKRRPYVVVTGPRPKGRDDKDRGPGTR
jgi:hypothetical protein